MLAAFLLLGAAPARGQAPAPRPEDGPSYPVSRFAVRYLHRHPDQPDRETLTALEIELGRTDAGYVAPREGVPSVTITLAEVEERPLETYYASAIQTILVRLFGFLAERDLIGVYVAADPTQITPAGEDLRPEGQRGLRIDITTGVVTGLRTLASGDRIPSEERVNNPLHARIIERSPLRPSTEGEKGRRDLLKRRPLDDYLLRLSRHPGRRVDAALSASEEPGGVTLDYLVAENRPLLLYAQVSNTGTRETDRLRERFGLVHTQLTNHDDILSLEYLTASFDEVNAVVGAYEAPFPGSDAFRWRFFGNWDEFTATQFGVVANVFQGASWSIGADVIVNVHQDGNLFVDIFGGLRFDRIEVRNELVGISGEDDFTLLRAGIRFDKQARWASVLGSLVAEWNDGQGSLPDPAELNGFGRLFPDNQFGLVRWDATGSVYLEPLLDRAAWADPSTPGTSTLAHELVASVSGQYAFDNRLVPQFQRVLGGLHTVRGYPQSVIAGDSALMASLEYRYHLPRALPLRATPGELFGKPFRVAPQSVYGRPDWDLVLKAFVDVGRNYVNDALFFESEETLIGAGVGLDFSFRRSLDLRLDWGFVLRGLDSRDVNSGSNRLHVVATIYF